MKMGTRRLQTGACESVEAAVVWVRVCVWEWMEGRKELLGPAPLLCTRPGVWQLG